MINTIHKIGSDLFVDHTNDPTVEVIFKYRKNPSTTVINDKCKENDVFNLIKVDMTEIQN